jgi:hypothetical protein
MLFIKLRLVIGMETEDLPFYSNQNLIEGRDGRLHVIAFWSLYTLYPYT